MAYSTLRLLDDPATQDRREGLSHSQKIMQQEATLPQRTPSVTIRNLNAGSSFSTDKEF